MGLLDEKVVIVTGATRGIGRSIAVYTYQQGAYVLATGRSEASLRTLAAEVDDGSRLQTMVVDVTKPGDVERAVANVVNRWGRLTGMVAKRGRLVPQRRRQRDA